MISVQELYKMQKDIANILETPNVDLSSYATKENLNTVKEELETSISTKETPTGAQNKANKAELNANSYTDTKVASLVDTAPETLDTLNELAAALGNDPNFATSMTTLIGTKAEKTYVDTELTKKADKSTTYTKSEVDTNIEKSKTDLATKQEVANLNTSLTTTIAGKVDKVTGKGLSSNDFTNAEKSKLQGLEIVDLTGYATEEFVDAAISEIVIPEVDLTGYAKKEEVLAKADKSDVLKGFKFNVLENEWTLNTASGFYEKTLTHNAMVSIEDFDIKFFKDGQAQMLGHSYINNKSVLLISNKACAIDVIIRKPIAQSSYSATLSSLVEENRKLTTIINSIRK